MPTEPRVVVVTAAGGLMGGSITRDLGERGHHLLLNDRRDCLDERTDEFRSQGVEVVTVVADVSTPDGAQEVIDTAVKQWGRIDVLVNVEGGTVTVGAALRSPDHLADGDRTGVDRVIVRPWTNSRTAADELREFANAVLPARDPLRDSLATP